MTQKIMTSKEELTPERQVFREIKITFPYTRICQRRGKKVKEKAPQYSRPHGQGSPWIRSVFQTLSGSTEHVLQLEYRLTFFFISLASLPCLGKCFWYEGTCSFRPQSWGSADKTPGCSEQPGRARGSPQLTERRRPLSLNLFSTPQPGADNV